MKINALKLPRCVDCVIWHMLCCSILASFIVTGQLRTAPFLYASFYHQWRQMHVHVSQTLLEGNKLVSFIQDLRINHTALYRWPKQAFGSAIFCALASRQRSAPSDNRVKFKNDNRKCMKIETFSEVLKYYIKTFKKNIYFRGCLFYLFNII